MPFYPKPLEKFGFTEPKSWPKCWLCGTPTGISALKKNVENFVHDIGCGAEIFEDDDYTDEILLYPS